MASGPWVKAKGSEAEEPWCQWCRREWVDRHGDICPACLDRRAAELNRAIRVNTPPAFAVAGRMFLDGEIEERLRPLVAERRRVLARMTRERRAHWRAVNAAIPLPPSLERAPADDSDGRARGVCRSSPA